MAHGKPRRKAKQETVDVPVSASDVASQPAGSSGDGSQNVARFPIVGVGASAGGLAAFEAFFSGMPVDADPGMAFVLVQHLAPDHKSILTELIRRYTRMQVYEVEDGMVVRPNCTYIIPPGRDMALLDGALQLLEPSAPRGQRLPIDFFFHSLALDQHERAVGIILSGTGSDGTLGIRAIKGEGGMVMAQSPGTTEFDGMPRSALGTGLVDYELSPAEMAPRLMAYAALAFGPLAPTGDGSAPKSESALKSIFVLLRAQTGHDFSLYKPNTIQRRIERRMAVHQIDRIQEYVRFLQRTPAEVDALFRDLLIGVTSFFRDPDVFQVLEQQVIPGLLATKPVDGAVRVWVPGCSTGEEAYSLAILLMERMAALRQGYAVQVFATDIDPAAIATARAGLYPASIAADVSAERLARFFVAEADGGAYRIHKSIRDLLVFSDQDLIKDPPFSKLDLISCRNVLIYMGAELQKIAIPLFHYALRPGGTLVLGTSEGIGTFDALFDTVDRKAKVYRRVGDQPGAFDPVRARRVLVQPTVEVAGPRGGARASHPVRPSSRELTEQALLQQLVAVGVLVNADGDILYLHGRSGLFLEPSPGESAVNNVVKMAREGLAAALGTTLRKALLTRETAYHPGVRVKTNGHFTVANVTVRPVMRGPGVSPEEPLFLVILEEVPFAADSAASDASPGGRSAAEQDAGRTPSPTEERLAALTRDLRAKEEYLQGALEELQSSTEELKSSNEEMQSVNEELQSTNEELETAKEELQSVNEELATVNGELQANVANLTRANDDMNNLLAGTGIGTVFLDHQLRILRFTPAARAIINLLPTDVGRPVAHLVSNFVGFDGLVAAAQTVLDTLVPAEMELQTKDGSWYLMRILPYRTLHNVIEGAVISFFDVTEAVRSRQSQRQVHRLERLAIMARDASDAIIVQDMADRTIAWNPAAVRLYGWTEAEALAMPASDRVPRELRADALLQLTQLSRGDALEPTRSRRVTKAGTVVEVSIISVALLNEGGQMYAIATTERAVSSVPG